MSDDLTGSMFDYYAQRAPEFDDVYLGGGPASISDPQAYRDEVDILARIVERTCQGDLLDLACGTAFWLPYYASRCSHITLFDQSQEMLAVARDRAASAGATDRTTTITGDALAYDFGEDRFDTALAAFLISHFTVGQEALLFDRLKTALKAAGQILILDSVWNDARAQSRSKKGPQTRTLADGRAFEIYKKYFDRDDLAALATDHGVDVSVEHFGKVYFAARVTFEGEWRLSQS